MDEQQQLGRRVGVLETRVAEVVTALGGLRDTLVEVKTAMADAKPPLWMLLPALIGMVGLFGTVIGFGISIQADLASMKAVEGRRDTEVNVIRARIIRLEEDDRSDLAKDRDYWRAKAKGEQ